MLYPHFHRYPLYVLICTSDASVDISLVVTDVEFGLAEAIRDAHAVRPTAHTVWVLCIADIAIALTRKTAQVGNDRVVKRGRGRRDFDHISGGAVAEMRTCCSTISTP